MSENVEANVRWRSRGMRLPYAGTLSAGPDGLRLTGHDATIGINVALLVPIYEIEGLTVIRSDALGGDEVLSLNLRNAEPVFIEPASPGSLPSHPLARALRAVTRRRAVPTEGGTR